MKIVYAGSPQFAIAPLKELLASGEEVIAVVTQPDRPFGRKKTLTPTPVKAFALSVGLPVYDFDDIRKHTDDVRALGGDIMVTCAYGQILSEEVLNLFSGGVWNLHASLLPRFRGASPIQSAILAGERDTGVTVMKTEKGLDCGDILLVKRCSVGEKTCGELSEELSLLSAKAAVEAIALLRAGNVQLLLQDDGAATYCKKIKKEDARLDFTGEAEELARKVRAFSPAPAAYCFLRGGALNILNCKVVEERGGKAGEVTAADKSGITVACGRGSIKITLLQPAGGRAMTAADFVNGRKIKAGDVLD